MPPPLPPARPPRAACPRLRPALTARLLTLRALCLRARPAAVCGSIARADVAELVVKALRSEKAAEVTLSAVDADQVFGSPQFDTFQL